MKKNVPKFVLAQNEAAKPGATYVVHTQEPSFIAEILRFSSNEELQEYISRNPEKEIVEVNPRLIIEVRKYLESSDVTKRRGFLDKRIKDWVIANYLS